MPLGFQTDPRGRPGGTAENSPAFQRLVITHIFSVLESTKLICNWLRGGLGG